MRSRRATEAAVTAGKQHMGTRLQASGEPSKEKIGAQNTQGRLRTDTNGSKEGSVFYFFFF